MVVCAVCELPFTEADPVAVVHLPRVTGEPEWGWVAFLEDWRGGDAEFAHPVCFAEVHGIAGLLAVIHRREAIERAGSSKLIEQRYRLRKRLDPN